jgi:hypothetical protein
MIEKGLYQLVTSDPGVQAAVGTDANAVGKAYWILAPQGASLPFLVLSRVGTVDPYTMAGPLGIRESLFQIACYGTTYYASRLAAAAVRNLLNSYTGTLPDGTVVQSTILDKDWDDHYEEGAKGFIFCAYLQFRMWTND